MDPSIGTVFNKKNSTRSLKEDMAQNTLYVRLNAETGVVGDPTRPFTLRDAVNYVNAQRTDALMFIQMANGSYDLSETPLIISAHVTITGTGPKNTVLNAYQITVNSGYEVTFQSCAIRSCRSQQLFQLVQGGLTLNNCEVTVNSGTLVRSSNGTLITNGTVIYIQVAVTNPVITAAQSSLFLSNTNLYYNLNTLPDTSLALVGTPPQQGIVALSGVGIGVQVVNGRQPIIGLYNVEVVNGGVVQFLGSGAEPFILVGNDIMPTNLDNPEAPQLPFRVHNVQVNIQKANGVYSYYNLHDYPLQLTNVTWSGTPQAPGPYTRTPTIQRMSAPLPPPVRDNGFPEQTQSMPNNGWNGQAQPLPNNGWNGQQMSEQTQSIPANRWNGRVEAPVRRPITSYPADLTLEPDLSTDTGMDFDETVW